MAIMQLHDGDVEITQISVVDTVFKERPWNFSHHKKGELHGENGYHLLFIQQGNYYHSAGENSMFIPEHSIVFIKEDPSPFCNTSAALPFRYVYIHFHTEDELPLTFDPFFRLCLAPDQCRGCEEKMLAALQIFRSRPFGWRLRLRGIVEELLLRIFTVYWEEQNEDNMPQLIKTGTELIRSRIFSAPLSVDEVARECGVTPAHLIRSFRRYLGMTPKQYMDSLRVEMACDLLKYTGKSMEAIAAESGFTEARQMRRVFRETVGVTPREYREQT